MRSSIKSTLVPLTNVEFEQAKKNLVGVYELYYGIDKDDIRIKPVNLIDDIKFCPVKTYFQQVNETTTKQMSQSERPVYQVTFNHDMEVLAIESANDVLVNIHDILLGKHQILNIEEVMYIYHWFGDMNTYRQHQKHEFCYPKRTAAERETLKARKQISEDNLKRMQDNLEFANRLEGIKYCVEKNLIQDEEELLKVMKQYEIPPQYVHDCLLNRKISGSSKIIK